MSPLLSLDTQRKSCLHKTTLNREKVEPKRSNLANNFPVTNFWNVSSNFLQTNHEKKLP